MYKDLVKILQSDDYLTDKQLKLKGEFVHEKDVLLQGGQYDGLTNNTNYTEVRDLDMYLLFIKDAINLNYCSIV
jgi:hypothetical protein